MEPRPEGPDKAGKGHRSKHLVGLSKEFELYFRTNRKSLKGFAHKKDIIRLTFLKIIRMIL